MEYSSWHHYCALCTELNKLKSTLSALGAHMRQHGEPNSMNKISIFAPYKKFKPGKDT
jgi:hypothetical protein